MTALKAGAGRRTGPAATGARRVRLAEILRRESDSSGVAEYASGVAMAQAGDIDEAFVHLDRMTAQRTGQAAFLMVDPSLDPLHGDPRWHTAPAPHRPDAVAHPGMTATRLFLDPSRRHPAQRGGSVRRRDRRRAVGRGPRAGDAARRTSSRRSRGRRLLQPAASARARRRASSPRRTRSRRSNTRVFARSTTAAGKG